MSSAATKIEDPTRGIARRRFLQGALAMGGTAGLVPGWLDGVAFAGPSLGPTDRIVVSLFLFGGNDGLNTLVPADDGRYQSIRGPLAVGVGPANSVGEGLYLHPALSRLKTRFDSGQVALIRGIGEPSKDHSHFSSTASWMSGRPGMANPTGWLGRWVDDAGLAELAAVSIGWGEVPLVLKGNTLAATSLPPGGGLFGADRAEDYERLAFESFSRLGASGAGMGPYGSLVSATIGSAVDTAARISPAYSPTLPADGLARDMALAAGVINLDVGARALNVSLDGFDNHNSMRPDHDDRMAELDAGIDAFFATLAPQFAGRTTLMVYSEFGRRVKPNNSGGTDHGAAGVAMVIGPRVNGGLYGAQPSLGDLDRRGDLKYNVDFRQMHATILEDWLGADSNAILGASFPRLDLFASPGPGGFFDVNANTYFGPAVGWLSSTGITTGTGVGEFSPGSPVSRAQMATFLWRYRGQPAGAPESPFVDVPRASYYAKAVDWLSQEGITTGTGFGRFSPDGQVDRAQMATFLWRLEGSPTGAPPSGLADVSTGKFYSKAVDWLLHRGITTGVGNNRFAPDQVVTRAQMATFLWRLAGSPT